MESLEFLGIIAIAAVIVGWYFHNAEQDAGGDRGVLAVKPDPTAAPKRKRRYRIRRRAAIRARDRRSVDAMAAEADAKSTYKPMDHDARMRRRFRRQDDVRYRVKDLKGDGVDPDQCGGVSVFAQTPRPAMKPHNGRSQSIDTS